jgi:hypothetical protein
MSITELRILPPFAIARLGSSPHPLDNFNLLAPPDGLGFRRIEPAETLYVDEQTGEIAKAEVPPDIRFREGDRIRPLAPFLEVFARTDEDTLEPLTLDLLQAHDLAPGDVKWTVRVGNTKVHRRTGKAADRVYAEASFSDHRSHPLEGRCPNFLADKVLPLGDVRYIKPNDGFPEIRLRFTPAHGTVYGASTKRTELDSSGQEIAVDDPVITPERVIYDAKKGDWVGYSDQNPAITTNPGSIYAGYDKGNDHISWGYLDDECDGLVSVELAVRGKALRAIARIAAGPPFFAPDGLPIRTVMDELEQVLHGPQVDPSQVRVADAEDIVQRAFETVRLMNTTVMNGNTVQGRTAIASMMPSQDANDYGRLFEPIMATTIVDNLSVLALHQAVFTALRSGTTPWFVEALRQPEEIGDLTNKGRRKMPAMMRGADGRYLTLTRRQIDTIRQAAAKGRFEPDKDGNS